jgi:hypothetical protein
MKPIDYSSDESDDNSDTSDGPDRGDLEPAGESIDGEEQMVKNIQVDPTGDIRDDDDNNLNADCVRNWRAAAADAKKGMFDCFDETGSFIATCKHTFVIVMCDMIRSGELYVYFCLHIHPVLIS